MKDLRQTKINRAMAQDNMQKQKENEIHIKTEFYDHKINGIELEEHLIYSKQEQRIISLIENTLAIRKGVATAAFLEDTVKL